MVYVVYVFFVCGVCDVLCGLYVVCVVCGVYVVYVTNGRYAVCCVVFLRTQFFLRKVKEDCFLKHSYTKTLRKLKNISGVFQILSGAKKQFSSFFRDFVQTVLANTRKNIFSFHTVKL